MVSKVVLQLAERLSSARRLVASPSPILRKHPDVLLGGKARRWLTTADRGLARWVFVRCAWMTEGVECMLHTNSPHSYYIRGSAHSDVRPGEKRLCRCATLPELLSSYLRNGICVEATPVRAKMHRGTALWDS